MIETESIALCFSPLHSLLVLLINPLADVDSRLLLFSLSKNGPREAISWFTITL